MSNADVETLLATSFAGGMCSAEGQWHRCCRQDVAEQRLCKKAVEKFTMSSAPTFEEIISILMEEAMPNPFCHVELNTTDLPKAKDFYTKLFDWKLEDMPGDYSMIRVGEGTGGGMMKNPVPGAPSFWLAYVLVDDIQASTKKAKSLGASVMKDVTEIPGYGSFSVLADPTGAHFALWKPNK